MEDWQIVNEFRHVGGIRKLFPNHTGTLMVFFDEKGDGFVYSAVSLSLLQPRYILLSRRIRIRAEIALSFHMSIA